MQPAFIKSLCQLPVSLCLKPSSCTKWCSLWQHNGCFAIKMKKYGRGYKAGFFSSQGSVNKKSNCKSREDGGTAAFLLASQWEAK